MKLLDASMELNGWEEIVVSIEKFDHIFAVPSVRAIAQTRFQETIDRVMDIVTVYPPQPDRMRSGRFNTYVRGIGRFPRDAFTDDGTLIGISPFVDRIQFMSEQLGQQWQTDIEVHPDRADCWIYNTASYADYVVGSRQVWFHELTGWPSLGGALDDVDIWAVYEDILDEITWMFNHGEL